MTTAPSASPTRREATRRSTIAAIKSAAMAQVAREGAAALTIRGVAREVGLSPAGMYRYYDGRDALLTDLLVDAYDSLADAVATAGGLAGGAGDHAAGDVLDDPGVADPAGALLAAIEAYRAWAVDNPARFLLLFGTPVPGYTAPEDGPTVAANRRMGRVFFTLGALAWRQGAGAPAGPTPAGPTHAARPGKPAGARRSPTPQELALLAQLRTLAPDLPAGIVPRMLAGWALWHGLVTLEITGQLHWAYPDAAGYYAETMRAWLDEFLAQA